MAHGNIATRNMMCCLNRLVDCRTALPQSLVWLLLQPTGSDFVMRGICDITSVTYPAWVFLRRKVQPFRGQKTLVFRRPYF